MQTDDTDTKSDILSEEQKKEISDKAGYIETRIEWLEKRSLKVKANAFYVWSLGVGAVISGDFFSWNFGLGTGFGSLLVATIVITIMYWCFVLSLSEMASALPFSGGAYGYARATMGRTIGFCVGIAEAIEFTFTVASIVVAIGAIMTVVVGMHHETEPIWWFAAYSISIVIHLWGGHVLWLSFVIPVIISILIIFMLFLGSIKYWDISQFAFNVEPQSHGNSWFVDGAPGFFKSIPSAIWFYLAIEQIPLAAEETFKPKKSLPIALITGQATLTITAFVTLFVCSSIAPGVATISISFIPFSDSFATIFLVPNAKRLLALLSLPGLIASFHCGIFAYTRQIFAMSRSGYLPAFLSLTYRQIPWASLLFGSVIGVIAATILKYVGAVVPEVGSALVNISTLAALSVYIGLMLSYIILKIRYRAIKRKFSSPLHIVGAIITIILSILSIVSCLAFQPSYKWALIPLGAIFFVALLYYFLWSRKRLRISPEEAFALFTLYRIKVSRKRRRRFLHPKSSKSNFANLNSKASSTILPSSSSSRT
eukprot:TRINITY_DN1118_c1_g1_i6.p1 TRINITY_DN1118_c1_g1~~TRINITY_DN1118_c1_g1_i6.p1  ORF type:complete len:540 (-),score=141.99 TRINITY_DN1118_c1_g1_i6:49-1668(-)